MDASRILIRVLLLVAFLVACSIPFVALLVRGADKPETWTVAAAALAVITSVISTWSGRRTIELQEDARKPKISIYFDAHSLNQLVLLRVKNTGGSSAHNISLEWDIPLHDSHGEAIGFFKTKDRAGISQLVQGESISQNVDVHHQFVSNHAPQAYVGTAHFEDSTGNAYSTKFSLDGRHLDGTPSYSDETLKTQSQLQKIPDELAQMRRLIENKLR